MDGPRIVMLLVTIAALSLFSGCKDKTKEEKITVAAAANTQYAMEELTKEFTKLSGIKCDLVLGSSGKLTAQITEGAPYDIFVSADMKYPEEIYKKGLAIQLPEIYAYGKLVLWTLKDNVQPSVAIMTDNTVEHIALANPKTAPYGKAAIAILDHYELFEQLEDKLVYGESISQTNQFIISKSAELGFTAMSTVLSPQMKGKGRWVELKNELYTPIEQGVIIIKQEHSNAEKVAEFYNFLFTPKARHILKNFGYSVDE